MAPREGQPLAWLLSAEYFDARHAFLEPLIAAVLGGKDANAILCGFEADKFDERVAEYVVAAQWLRDHCQGMPLLDVGCTMNNAVVKPAVDQFAKEIWFCNPALELPVPFDIPIYYHASRLEAAFPGHSGFSLITCLSTIEHIGYDNSQYGVTEPARFKEPQTHTLVDACSSLARLARRDAPARLLISVPFGKRESLIHPGSGKRASQVFDSESLKPGLAALVSAGFEPRLSVRAAQSDGWRLVDPESCQARYADGRPAAGAVAFIEAVRYGEVGS